MIKSHPESRFALYSLEQIRDTAQIILQIEKTESKFNDTNLSAYLCEVVPKVSFRPQTADRLTDEIIRVNTENRRLQAKVTKLENALRRKENPC